MMYSIIEHSALYKCCILLLLLSSPECFGIASRVSEKVYCRFDKTCTSFSCCVELKMFVFRRTLKAFVRYDPCALELRLGFSKWTAKYVIVEEDFGMYPYYYYYYYYYYYKRSLFTINHIKCLQFISLTVVSLKKMKTYKYSTRLC